MTTASPHAVVVVGSITADVTTFSPRLPVPGETLLGDALTLVLGGKGANQAVAASRAGACTTMIGCIGDDIFHDLVLDGLAAGGVDTGPVTTVPGPTGVAHIRVNSRTGQNDIVMVPLANGALTPDLAEERLRATARSGDVLLLQLEIPAPTTLRAAHVGRELGMTVILDPAPAAQLPEDVWPFLHVVTPNESEATILSGITVEDVATATAAGRWFAARGVGRAVITLAERGVVVVEGDACGQRVHHLPAPPVDVVDTTAAGDAFTGALGAALAGGAAWEDALRYGVHAGALAVTVAGASPSLPTAAAVEALLQRSGRGPLLDLARD